MIGSYNEPFDDCDVFVPRLEGHDPAVPDVFANGKWQKAVQALFPDLLIAWRRLPESLGFVPSGWLWARLNVHKMAELSKGHKLAKVGWCDCRQRPSPTKCGKNIVVAC